MIASVLTDGDTNGVSQNAIAARIRALDKTIKEQGQLIKTLTEKYGADQTAQRLSNLENNQKNQALRLQLLRNALIPSLTLCLTHNSLAERHHWLETANVTSLLCINLKRYLPFSCAKKLRKFQ